MKRIIPTIIIVILAFSCAKEEPVSRILVDDILTKGDIKEDSYAVTYADIKNYLHFKQLENSELKLKSIEPFEYEGQTFLYVLNYNKGWEVISADKRTQVVLAKGEEGSFTMKDYKETPWGTWVYTLAMDVRHVKEQNIQVAYNENADYEFWGQINGPLYSMPPVPPPVIDTTSIIVRPIILEPIENVYGYYELSDVSYIYNVDTISVPRLTTTSWKQNSYTLHNEGIAGNSYVPLKYDGSKHVPSGCTPVAGAQMAYYLHEKIGQPEHRPHYLRKCTRTIGNSSDNLYITDPNFWPDNFTNEGWNQMDSLIININDLEDTICTNSHYADMLIAYIGRRSDTWYYNIHAGATLSDMQRGYFNNYLISSQFYNHFDADIVYDELANHEMPVIVSAFTAETGGEGHTFIIDGCKYSRKRIVYTYEWHWYERYLDGTCIIPDVPPRTELGQCRYQEVLGLHMNWGWSAKYNNSTDYFAPSGDWNATDDQDPEYSYNYRKVMLGKFRLN